MALIQTKRMKLPFYKLEKKQLNTSVSWFLQIPFHYLINNLELDLCKDKTDNR